MSNLLKLINTALIEERKINIDEFVDGYKKSKALKEKLYEYGPFNNFNSRKWRFFNELIQEVNTIDFDIFNDLINSKIVSEQDLLLVKCFLVDKLSDVSNPLTIGRYKNSIYSIINITNNFTINNENELFSLLQKEKKYPIISAAIVDYINFLESLDCADDGHLITLSYYYDHPTSNNRDAKRELPENSDILAFDYYLKKFYKYETDDIVRNLFKPVLLWYKISCVIPFRSSEFAYKLKRDCLKEEDDKYYLFIDRVKVDKDNKKTRKNASIPLLRKLEITKDIYDLVNDYIECTSFDDSSKTLLSYKAYKHFSNEYYRKYKPNSMYTMTIYESNNKKYSDSFNRENLQNLIDNFYKEIITGRYKDTSIKDTLRVGDTRHLAFCSLMLQGVSPVEIAMLGGHTTLSAQDHYIGHATYYIDSEMLNFIAHRTIKPEIDDKNLKDIILKKPNKPYKDLIDCHITEDKIGYCTADFKTDVCDSNKRTCILCKKWWCYPSNDNYVKAKEYINGYSLGPLKDRLLQEEEFLSKLLKTAKVVNIDDLIELDKSYGDGVRSKVNQIKSTADEILFLQKALLEIEERNKNNS